MGNGLFRIPGQQESLEIFRVPVYLEDKKWKNGAQFIRAGFVLAAVLLLILLSALLAEVFASGRNWGNMMTWFVPSAVLALAMTVPFGKGGLDLSVGYVGAVSGSVMVLLLNSGLPAVAAMTAGLFVALLFGLFNGVMAGFLRIPGLIVTLITAFGARMVNLAILNGMTIPFESGFPGGLFLFFKVGAVLILLALAAGLVYLNHFHRPKKDDSGNSGKIVPSLAIGLPYVLTGVLAGFAGMHFATHLGAASTGAGTGTETNVLFALVFGGAILGGKAANPVGVFLAALFLAILQNISSILGINIMVSGIITIALLVCALVFNFLFNLVTAYLYNRKKG